jgi:hypothetical protein
MTSRELATHIYYHIQNVTDEKKKKGSEINDKDEILYIENLMVLHFEIENNLGSKGFVSISKEIK